MRHATGRARILISRFRRRCHIWVEYVDTDSNWSDGISREFGDDPFARVEHFEARRVNFDLSCVGRSYGDLWRHSKTYEKAEVATS